MHQTSGWIMLMVLAAAFPTSAATVDVSIEPSVQYAAVGGTARFEVWLRNIDGHGVPGMAIESLELDFGVLPVGVSFEAGPGIADGFGEHDAPIPSELDTILDGSLLDDHTVDMPDLSYVAFHTSGIPADDGERLIGTFWVQAGAEGSYPLSLDNSCTSILSGDLTEFGENYFDALLVVPPTPGDANLDGSVDGADYTIWADHYFQAGGWEEGDFSGDGIVDGADYTIWADNYTGPTVPAPAVVSLLALGFGIVLKQRCRWPAIVVSCR